MLDIRADVLVLYQIKELWRIKLVQLFQGAVPLFCQRHDGHVYVADVAELDVILFLSSMPYRQPVWLADKKG